MINLNAIFRYKDIINLGYDSVYIEQPTPDIIDFEWKNILKPPPSNTSREVISELNTISKFSSDRDKKEEQTVLQIDQDPDSIFIQLCKNYSIKYPYDKINLFYNIIKPVIFNIKSLWNRPRPSQLAKYYGVNINVLVTDTHHTAAYPSGHTAYANLVALILKELYPIINHRDLEDLVTKVAKARMSQGVHYPSDNKASLVLSQFLFNQLKDKIL
jgi:hypothetical protein